MYDISKLYIKYNEDILDKNIISNKLIYQACERMKSWFARADIFFDYEDVDRKIRFMQKLKHSKGQYAGKNFELLPYQQWITANIIGWKWKETKTRVINMALLMLSRKAGKTFFAAALMLAIIMTDAESGAEGYMIANSAAQAGIAFEHCKGQASSIDPKGKIFSRYRSEIRIPLLDSKIKVLSSDTTTLDGLNPSVFIVDEFHEAKSNEIVNVLRTGQGIRQNPLGCIITTAGFNVGNDFPLYELWTRSKAMLSGTIDQDTLFAAIYQLDDEDDFKDESVWIKSNPTLGQTVSYKYLREQVNQAITEPSSEVSIKTKNFNMFCQSAQTWIPNDNILEVTQSFDLSMFDKENEYCIIGVDLAERSDLCVVTTLVKHNDLIYLKAFPFICNTAYNTSANKELYRQWVKKGYLILVDAESIDIDWVIKYVQDINEQIPVAIIGYDPYHARQFCIACEKQGLPMRAVKQGLGSFGEPTSMLEHMIYRKQVVIDDNPCIRWCFSNVLIKTDENENRKPIKSSADQKIDIVIAFIQSMRIHMELEGLIDETPIEAVALS